MSLLMRGLIAGFVVSLALPVQAQKVVLGKLGQTLQPATIYRQPTTNSGTYYRVKSYEYIVVKEGPNAKYLKVLMANGAYGYINSAVVAKLPYDAVADKAPTRPGRDMGSVTSRSGAADYSLKFTGTPYVWGGNDPNKGVDCSGFVKYLYGQIGVNLPRTAAEQALVGTPILRLEDLQKGDRLYFWSDKRNKIGHTGIYLGNGYFCHSSYGKGQVTTDHLGGAYWRKTLVAARR